MEQKRALASSGQGGGEFGKLPAGQIGSDNPDLCEPVGGIGVVFATRLQVEWSLWGLVFDSAGREKKSGCHMNQIFCQFGGFWLPRQGWWAVALLATLLPVEGLARGAATGVVEGRQGVGGAAAEPGVKQVKLAKLDVVVTIGPLRGITARIVPEGSVIEQLIPSGVSEHGYEIAPGKLRLLAKADLVVRIGEALEPQVEKALLGSPRAARGVVTMLPDEHDEKGGGGEQGSGRPSVHDHEPGEACDEHKGSDPHVWLDPVLMERFAEQIGAATTAALIARTPDVGRHEQIAKAIAARVATVTLEIRGVDVEYKAVLSRKAHRTIVVTHDAWGHLAGRYGLKTVPLKGLSATEPTMASLKLAAETVKREGLTTVFLEPQLSRAAGERIAEATGVKTAMLDPLGNGDWFAMMRGNLLAIAASLPESVPVVKPVLEPK